ncbi:nucleoside hydrolase [Enterococcus bulliens]
MKKLILDVDTGIDDAFAILYALAQSQQAELIGITTSFGNVQVKQATRNTLQILELFQAEIPVYIGADRSISC